MTKHSKCLVVSAIFLLYLLSVPCLGIIGGRRVPNLPFFVTIKIAWSPTCGGTIVASNAVLTAAHCLYDIKNHRWFSKESILVTKHNLSQKNRLNDEKLYTCRHYTSHKSYERYRNDGLMPFDIAVMKLERNIDLTKHVDAKRKLCPETGEYRVGVFLGMGLAQKQAMMESNVLKAIKLYNLPCAKFFKELGVDTDEDKQACYRYRGRTCWSIRRRFRRSSHIL